MVEQAVTKREINQYLSRCNEALRDIRTMMSQAKHWRSHEHSPSAFRSELRELIVELTGNAGEVENLLIEYYSLEYEPDSPVPRDS